MTAVVLQDPVVQNPPLGVEKAKKGNDIKTGGRNWVKFSKSTKGVEIAGWVAIALAVTSAVVALLGLFPIAIPLILFKAALIVAASTAIISLALSVTRVIMDQSYHK